ncbi:MAG: GTPase HflX [Rhodospirillales bacterium]|nr:GTPase HflX [Rhodospirillales bacterium]
MVHPELKGERLQTRAPAARLAEAVGLARGIELAVVHAEVIRVPRVRPATLFGRGTVDRLRLLVNGAGGRPDSCDNDVDDDEETPVGEGSSHVAGAPAIDVAIVDAALSPVQQRNLEKALGCKVIDRTGLILEIFGARARTREGRLQVELAALTYQRSRLVRSWTHLERQRGGFGFMGGPGEAQIEIDRRILSERITRLNRELKEVKRTRAIQRRARQRVPYPVVALVGYTNAGKSTLFNRLTQAAVAAKDQLFATLDPTMRGLRLPSGRNIILSDTVGFISDLPHELVAAFQATLEEVCEADVVVHVRDMSHPDSEAQREDVHGVLSELGLEATVDAGLIEALNKIDLLLPEHRGLVVNQAIRRIPPAPPAVPLSAVTGQGCAALLAALDARLTQSRREIETEVALTDGAALAWLYAHGEVVSRRDDERLAHLRVRLDAADAARFARRREGGQT